MDRPVLIDPAVFPDDVVLNKELAAAKNAWDAFMALLGGYSPVLSVEWRYYNDGKSWLCKVTQKKKTLAWVAVWDKYFTVGSYLNARAEGLVLASSLDKALKDGFLTSDKKLRAIQVEVRKKSDLAAVRELLEIKLSAK